MNNRRRRRRPKGNEDQLQLIQEFRGGWDEWSDERWVNVGFSMPNGDKFICSRLEDFKDQNGNPLTIEVVSSQSNKLFVERYEPEYGQWVFTVEQLDERLDYDDLTIQLD